MRSATVMRGVLVNSLHCVARGTDGRVVRFYPSSTGAWARTPCLTRFVRRGRCFGRARTASSSALDMSMIRGLPSCSDGAARGVAAWR